MHDLRERKYPLTSLFAAELENKLRARFDERNGDAVATAQGTVFSYATGKLKASFVPAVRNCAPDNVTVVIVRQDETIASTAYLGFKNAIADFFVAFRQSHNQEDILRFAKALRRTLGDRYPILTDFVPEAELYPGQSGAAAESSLEIEKQIIPLVSDLFVFLAAHAGHPVLLFTEDLHWMDGPAFNLLKHLLLRVPGQYLIWSGSYMAGETDAVPAILDEFRHDGIAVEEVQLHAVSRQEIVDVVRESLGALPPADLIDVVIEFCGADVEKILRFLDRMREEGGITVNANVFRWDRDAIRKVIQDEQHNEFRVRWSRFPDELRDYLAVAVCVDGDEAVLQQWLNRHEHVRKLLKEGTAGQVIARNENGIPLPLPSLLAGVRSILAPEEKSRTHYTLAKTLLEEGPAMRRIVADHLNQALDHVRQNGEQRMCAELNSAVASACWNDHDLAGARRYYSVSAELLRDLPWIRVADAFSEVNLHLARLEYQLGDYDLAEHKVDLLLERVEDTTKRASLYELKIIINNRLGRYRKSVLILKEGLAEIGLDMPLNDEDVDREVRRLQESLLTNPTHSHNGSPDYAAREKCIRKLLFVGGMSLHHASSALMTWGALQIIHRSGDGPDSGEKAIGYVVYGRVHMIRHEIDRGFAYGSKAVQINQELNDVSLRCRVFGIYAFFILPWKRPAAESKAFLEEAFVAGTRTGDLIGTYVIRTHQLNISLLSGKPLSEALTMEFEGSDPAHELTYYITHYQKNLVRFLVGRSTLFSIPHLQPSWLAASNTIQEEKFYRNFVWSRYYFLFGYYHLSERASQEANANRKLQEGSLLIPANLLIWFVSVTRNWQNYTADERDRYPSFLNDVLSRFERWSEHCPENFKASFLLLQAEYLKLHGSRDITLACYRDAIAHAGDNLWHKAVAAECCFTFLAGRDGRTPETLSFLRLAIDLYTQWGATAKVSHLLQQYGAFYFEDSPDRHRESPGQLNIEIIQQELSGDLQVESIVKKLLVLCTRISGSTAALLQSVESNGEMTSLGQYELLFRARPSDYPWAIRQVALDDIRQAVRTQHHVVSNSYDQAPALSYLVVPVTIRDHMSFVLYLENDMSAQGYTDAIVKWIRITLNQGAMMIENARIHEVTLRLNAEIREKMEEKERLMDEIRRQRDDYLRSLEATQNQDRMRIATHLHDSVGSMLSSVRMRLNSMQDEIRDHLPSRSDRYAETVNLVDEAVQELRRIVYNMVPVSLSRFGLQATLQTFVDQLNDAKQIAVELQILGLDERLPDELEMAIYRICQELVQNVLKHANATFLRIQLIRRGELINLIVEDNGRGMDTASITKGLGFNTIENKVRLYDGTFAIESTPERGTMILLDIPMIT